MAGKAMCEFGEICTNGTIPQKLFSRMKRNSAVKYGANATPFGPIISTAMLLRTKPYALSASHCFLVGTSLGFRYATRKKMMRMAVVTQTRSVILVNQ